MLIIFTYNVLFTSKKYSFALMVSQKGQTPKLTAHISAFLNWGLFFLVHPVVIVNPLGCDTTFTFSNSTQKRML